MTVDITTELSFNRRVNRTVETGLLVLKCASIKPLLMSESPLQGSVGKICGVIRNVARQFQTESCKGFLFIMAKVNSFLPVREPNYTQVPNILLDNLDEVSDSELRLLLLLCRQTFGWHKERAKMSISFMQKGATLSSQGVINAVKSLMKRELIGRAKCGMGYEYFLVVKPLNDVDQLSKLTSQRCVELPLNDVDQLSQQPLNDVGTNKQIINKVKQSLLATDVKDFLDKWEGFFFEAFGVRYAASPTDAKIVAPFLASGFTEEELLDIAKKAWARKNNGEFSWSKQALSIKRFFSNLNDIRHEITSKPNARGNAKVDLNAGTLNNPNDYAGV